MQFIVDIYWRALGLLYIIAVPLVLVAVPAFVIAAFVYVLAAPELRMRMVGWAPGVQHGVKKTLGLARALQSRSPGGAG